MQEDIRKVMKAIFLDRDGVINELVYHQEQGVIDSPFTVEQFRLLPGVGKAIRSFHGMGYKVIVVSNQPGIAKGHLSWETFDRIRQKMKEELAKETAFVDREYYCFHHPEAKVDRLRADCECRKPKPGLLLQAAKEMDINLSQSWMAGDGLTDVKAGKGAGTKTIFLGRMKCELCHLMDEENARPDAVVRDLSEAVKLILQSEERVGDAEAKKARRWGEQFIPHKRIPYFLLQAFIGKYVFASQFVKGKVVLDIASGSGYGAKYLKYKGASVVVGGDISEEATKYATKYYQKHGLYFLRCDAQRLPFADHSFDVVVSCETIEHLPRYKDFLSECRRVLKDGGHFICATPNREFASPYSETPLNPYHTKEFTIDELKDLVSAYFGKVGIFGMDPQGDKADKIVYRIALEFQPIVYSIPKSYLLINFITKFIFRRYSLVRAEKLKETEFDEFLEPKYRHYSLEDSFLPPGGLTAVAIR